MAVDAVAEETNCSIDQHPEISCAWTASVTYEEESQVEVSQRRPSEQELDCVVDELKLRNRIP